MAQREVKSSLQMPEGAQFRLALVRSEFNSHITLEQIEYAKACCEHYGVAYDMYTVAGAYEIPWMIARLLRTQKYHGAVALGCLIKGETPHFEIIAESVARALSQLQIQENSMPIGFGIITALTEDQARVRTVIGQDATHAVLQSLIQTYAF